VEHLIILSYNESNVHSWRNCEQFVVFFFVLYLNMFRWRYTKIVIILPIVLYGCVSWTDLLIEKHRLRLFQNSYWEGNVGFRRGEVTVSCRILRNEELYNSVFTKCYWSVQDKDDYVDRACSTCGREKKYNV
jgi:hypothetical protein